MLKFKPGKISLTCLALLSLSLLNSSAFGYDDNRVSYLDSVAGSYMNSGKSGDIKYTDLITPLDGNIETTMRLDSATPITRSKAIINLSLRDSDIRQVLRMLADKAGLNIVFDDSIKGKLTLDLNNVTVNDAFLTIFKSSQLTYLLENNTLTVMTLEASKKISYTRKNMTVLPVKYVNVNSVAEFLNENLFKSNIFGLSNRPVVTSNPSTNQLVVFGSNEDVMAIKRVLPILDVKPQIHSFVVNHTTPKEMAQLICDTFFSLKTKSDKLEDDNSDEDEKIVLGGGKIACRDNFGTETKATETSNTKADAAAPGEVSLKAFAVAPLSVSYYSSLGKIAVTGGSAEQVETIREFIKQNDKKQLMAYLEMSIIELNETGSKTFNNTWELWTPFISLKFDDGGLGIGQEMPFFLWGDKYTTVTKTYDYVTNEMTNGTYKIRGSRNRALMYTLKYLVENGNGRTLTNPKVMVTNGKKTVIDMTSDYIKSVTEQIIVSQTGASSATQTTYNIGNDEGLKIELVPFISPEGYVSLNITPELASIKEQPDNRKYTLLQRRDLELKNVRIRDGETLVLAGLIKENETQSAKKMPILSDLPFVGSFFRNNNDNKAREELVIVITPHLITDNETQSNTYDL